MVPRARARVRVAVRSAAAIQQHVHTGPLTFLFAGIAAIVTIQLVKLAAAELVKRPVFEPAGKVLGSLIQTD